MAEVLSQKEIDEILTKITSEDQAGVEDYCPFPSMRYFYDILERALSFCEKARRGKFKEIEDSLDQEKIDNRDIFEYGMRFIVDGYDSPYIDKILSNIIKQEKDKQQILLKTMQEKYELQNLLKTIQKEAVLAIQEGVSPNSLAALLNSYTDIPLNDPKFKEMRDASTNSLKTLIYGFQKPELVIISSTPEKGKTLLALTMVETMVCGGKPAAFISLKESEDAIMERLSKIEPSITDGWDIVPIQRYPYLVHSSRMTLLELEKHIRKECGKRKRNIEAVFVDDLDLLSGGNTEYAVWITKLKALAKVLNILIVVVLQIPEDKECSQSSVESMISSAEALKCIDTLIIINGTDAQERVLDIYKAPGTVDVWHPEKIGWRIP